jgi:hypothetical protein
MKPTDEQIFDYFLDELDPQSAREVDEYLAANPEEQLRLKEFAQVAQNFQSYPIVQPSEAVVARVLETGHKYAGEKESVLTWLSNVFTVRKMGWIATVFVIVGLSYALNGLRDINTNDPALGNATLNGSQTTAIEAKEGDSVESFQITKALNDLRTMNAHEVSTVYGKAKTLFGQGQYKDAHLLFSQIMAVRPGFEQSKDLYTHWVKALTELGYTELAEEKEIKLKQLQ